jgi:hypothetical protein
MAPLPLLNAAEPEAPPCEAGGATKNNAARLNYRQKDGTEAFFMEGMGRALRILKWQSRTRYRSHMLMKNPALLVEALRR